MGGRRFPSSTRVDDVVKKVAGYRVRRVFGAFMNTGVVLFMLASNTPAEEPKQTTHMWTIANDNCTVRITGRVVDTDTTKRGVGFLVNESGYMVTAKHVLDRLEEVELRGACGHTSRLLDSVTFAKYSQHSDLAVMKLKFSSSVPRCSRRIEIADETSIILPGTKVEIRTWVGEDKNFMATGRIQNTYKRDSLRISGIQIREIPGPKGQALPWGCSGSPVFARGTRTVLGCLVTAITETQQNETIWMTGLPDYGAVHVNEIERFLSQNDVSFKRRHFDPHAAPQHSVNPVKKGEERPWFIGMLELILFSIQDIVQTYDQFENKDTDILIETFLQTSSFIRKISKSDYPLTDARQMAVFFFIKGLAMKASRRHAFPASRQYFERAVYEDSTFVDATYQLARYHLMVTGDSAAAIEHLRKALELEPENGEVLRVLGIYYMHHPKDDSAKVYIEKAAAHLPPDDPRIPFYLGIIHDPYWSIVKPMARWVSDFQQVHGREPGVSEVGEKRKQLLDSIPNRDDSLKVAIKYYKESISLNQGYIRPLNAVVWALANEVLEDSSSNSLRNAELLAHLNRMSTFVGYGLVDPRSFNTLALGFSAINDCESACEYWKESMKTLRDIELNPGYRNDLKRENERVTGMCACGYKLFEERSWK